MATAQILVTGGAGFVGGHLLPTLRRHFPGHRVAGLEVDVTDDAAVAAAIGGAQPQAVVHLAAVAAPAEARRDPGAAWRVNLHGTLSVARACRDVPGCTLVFASSADAYGASFAAGAVDERAPLAPRNAYAATKAAADLALGAMACDGLRVLRLRPFNHTGPGQSEAYAVPAFARQIARIEAGLQPCTIEVGALDAVRDFLDVRDVCEAYAAACRADALPPGTVLNVASGTGRRIGDILAELIALAGVEAEIRTDPARLRPNDVSAAIGHAEAARRALGWVPRIPWRQTLGDVLNDWRRRVRG